MSRLSNSFEEFDKRANSLDRMTCAIMERFIDNEYWLPLASSTLSRAGIPLNGRNNVVNETDKPTVILFATYYLKNLLRFVALVFELVIFKSITYGQLRKTSWLKEPAQVIETFMMTNRIEQGDFSHDFAGNIEIPDDLNRFYFGSIFGGGLLNIRARIQSARRVRGEINSVVHYDVLTIIDLYRLFLDVMSFPFLLLRMQQYVSTINGDKYIKNQIMLRFHSEYLENKVDTLARYYTGRSMVKRLNIIQMVSWSENQIWHKVFFRGMSDAGFDLEKLAAFEFFNVNLDSQFATYIDNERQYRCVPGVLLAKGRYFKERHTHHNAQLAYAYREAYVHTMLLPSGKEDPIKKMIIGILLPYSIEHSLELIAMGQNLEDAGQPCCYRLHPNNRNSKVLLNALQDKIISEEPVSTFLSSLGGFVGSGSGICLEAMVLAIPVFVPMSQMFSNPLPREFLGKKWWVVAPNEIVDIVDKTVGKQDRRDLSGNIDACYFFEPINCKKLRLDFLDQTETQ